MNDWMPNTEQVRDGYRYNPEDDYYNPEQAGANAERAGRDFDRWLDQTLREAKAEAWEDGYRQGIADERNAEALKVDNGFGGYYTPNRANPYQAKTHKTN